MDIHHVKCAICKRKYQELTAEHLKGHGITPEQYRRIYNKPLSADEALGLPKLTAQPRKMLQALKKDPPPVAVGAVSNLPQSFIQKTAEQVAQDPTAMQAIAKDVSDYMVAGPISDLAADNLHQILLAQSELSAKAAANLKAVSDELFTEDRIKKGGPNNTPTPTKDLIAMHAAALKEKTRAEDLLLRTVRTAIDEVRAKHEIQKESNHLDKYTGAAQNRGAFEQFKKFDPADREVIRKLMRELVLRAGETDNTTEQQDAEKTIIQMPAAKVTEKIKESQED